MGSCHIAQAGLELPSCLSLKSWDYCYKALAKLSLIFENADQNIFIFYFYYRLDTELDT